MYYPRPLLTTACLALVTALTAGALRAQELPTPGPEHQALKRLEGDWTATVKMPESSDTSTATATYKMVCGGLWLSSDFHSDFGGQPFQGRGMDGYDPAKKKYVSVWVDSMSTRPLFLEGTHDAEKKTTTMTGEGPGMDGRMVKYKTVTHMPDADHLTFNMYLVGEDGKENKLMTIEYVRKK